MTLPILAEGQILALIEFSLKARLSCGQKRPDESTSFKGKENRHFSSVLFSLSYREYLYFSTGLKLVCLGVISYKAKVKAVMDNLEFPECIYLLMFEARDRSGLKSAGEVKRKEFGFFKNLFKDLIGFIE